MKALFYRILICIISVSQTALVSAQKGPVSDLNDELHQLFSGLKKPLHPQFGCQSPFLWDMSSTVSDDYKGNLGLSDVSVSFDWYTQHFEFKNRAYKKGLLPATKSLNMLADEIYEETRKIPIGVMDFSYYEFTDNAFDIQGQYFGWDDYKIWDVARPNEPYKTLSNGDYNLIFFKCAPLIEASKYRKVTYQFNPLLIFYASQYSCHFKPSPQNEFQVNFGNGWQTVNANVITDIEIIYPHIGSYAIEFRILEDGNTRRLCKSTITITTNDLEPTPPSARLSIAGVNINVYNPCNAFDHTNYKPLIYVSGIDLGESKNVDDLYKEFIEKGELTDLNNNGYKIFVVDWKNSRQSLTANAAILVDVINEINIEMKNDENPNQIVILGSSIGGIISRYAITSMEDNNHHAWHNCRLLVTLDSPHQGANVPLGLQHIASSLIGFTGLNPAFSAATYYMDKQAHFAFLATELLDQPAVKQMLTYHVNAKTILSEYPRLSDRISFLTDLYSNKPQTNGYPEQCRVVLISNGTFNDTRQMRFGGGAVNPGDLLFGIGASVKVTIFKKISFKVFDWSVDSKSMPDGNGTVLEIPFGLYGIKMIGCVGKILRALWRPSTFLSTIAGCINTAVTFGNEYAIHVKDIDGMSGGNASYIPLGKTLSTFSPSFNLGGFLSGYAGILVENPNPCFVPAYSAIDLGGPLGQTASDPKHIDFTTMPIDQIVNSNGATVVLSSNANWTHNQWGADIKLPTLIREPIKEKEIAPDNMRLDNYNLTRRAYFESKYSISAGEKIWEPQYSYPSNLPNHYKPMSKENGFIVSEVPIDVSMPDDWNYVTFKAGNQIVLKPGFAATLNSRFHAYLQSEPECPPQLTTKSNPSMQTQYHEPVKLLAITTRKFEPPIEETKDIRLTLWPNPAQQYITLTISNIAPNSVPYLTLMSMTGKSISVQVPLLPDGQTELTLRIQANEYGLDPGIYLVHVQCNNKNYTSKISIQP